MHLIIDTATIVSCLVRKSVASSVRRITHVSPLPVSRQDQSPGNHGNAGKDPVTFHCELDPKLTEADLPFFIPDIKGNWGAACGRNRGVFVLDPPDGHTYGKDVFIFLFAFLFVFFSNNKYLRRDTTRTQFVSCFVCMCMCAV